jgi:hypothetical protein
MRTIRVCMAGCVCGLVLTGCAAAHEQTPTVAAASMRADEQPSEERQHAGWLPCDLPRTARCHQALGICEQRVARMAAPSDFWDGSGGRVLLIGLGLLAGMGLTAGLAIALE